MRVFILSKASGMLRAGILTATDGNVLFFFTNAPTRFSYFNEPSSSFFSMAVFHYP